MPKTNLNNFAEAMSNWIVGPDAGSSTPSVDLQTLEDRVLYSAGPVPVDLTHHVDVVEPGCDALDCFDSIDTGFEGISDAFESYELASFESEFAIEVTLGADPMTGELGSGQTNELVIVDTTVEGYEQLVNDLLSQATTQREFEVVYLSGRADGIGQITSALATRSNLDAIHLVSHGSDGELRLGNTTLNGENLNQYATEFSSWQNALSDNADLLIYGCEVAETEQGQ